jgi:hypothetical protein
MLLERDRTDVRTSDALAVWKAMLADMPQEWVARQLSTETLRAVLVSRGYCVEPPRGWPRMGDEDG